jgi:hypothetical protein
MVHNLKALRHVFRYYCAVTVGSTDPWNMTLRNYENLLKGSKIKVSLIIILLINRLMPAKSSNFTHLRVLSGTH